MKNTTFKVGDKVKITDNTNFHEFEIGTEGVVIEVIKNKAYCNVSDGMVSWCVLYEDMELIQLKAYVTIDGYCGNESGVYEITGKDKLDLLIKAIEKFLMYDEDDLEEFKQNHNTIENVLDYINDINNGDGSDCIFSIITNRGELIYKINQ